jgi:hypothetical protein
MYDVDKLRRTGRTTRMLEEALRSSDKGYAVCVITHSHSHANTLRAMLEDLSNLAGHEVRVMPAAQADERDFDWRLLRFPWGSANQRVLVDHWAIESRYAALLEMLHLFDKV